MQWDEAMSAELGLQMQAVSQQMNELSQTVILWMVACAVFLILLLVILIMLSRMRRRNRKVEDWLVREMRSVQQKQDDLVMLHTITTPREQPAPQAYAPAAVRPQQQPKAAAAPARRPAPAPQQPQPQPEPQAQPAPPREAADLIALVNELLAGNQPYNFIESARAIAPNLQLQRMAPRSGGDIFTEETVLEAGGDGLFADIREEHAQLYPNYSRFSATFDPKPLFEGARHGGRIHSVLKPAILSQQADGSWILTDKGRVQMRQGNL